MLLSACTAISGTSETAAPTAPASTPMTTSPPSPPTHSATPGATVDAQGCSSWARISITRPDDSDPWSAGLDGDLVDHGPRPGANGTPILDATGALVGYRVVEGDALAEIGPRFCVDHITVASYNGYWMTGRVLQPGDELVLRPAQGAGWSYAPTLSP